MFNSEEREAIEEIVTTKVEAILKERDYEIKLRLVRIEEELKNQRELILQSIENSNKRFEQVDKRLEQVDKRFEDMNKRFEQVDKRFEDMNKRFEQVDKRFEQMDRRFEQVDKRFEQMDRRFEEMNKRIDAFMKWSITTTVLVGGIVVSILKLV